MIEVARTLADKIAQIDSLLGREENDRGYEAFVHIRKIWPELKAAALRTHLTGAQEREAWRCFHCGEVFADADSAKEHFGPDTEWQAGCVDPLTKNEQERRKDQVDMYEELDREREENSRLTGRDYVLSCFERDIAKHFNGAKSVHQAFLVLDAMKGRALAAEERLAALPPAPMPERDRMREVIAAYIAAHFLGADCEKRALEHADAILAVPRAELKSEAK